MEPLERFREIAKEQLVELKVSHGLKQQTLQRIYQEKTQRKPRRWVWPAMSSSAALLAVLLFWNSGMFDMNQGSKPSHGITDPVTPPIAGEPPDDTGISILTDPDVNTFSGNSLLDDPSPGAYTLGGELVPLPDYVPGGFQLVDRVMDEAGGSIYLQYASDEQRYDLVVSKPDQLEAMDSPVVKDSDPLVAEWTFEQWHYTLTGQLSEDTVLAIAESLNK